MRRQAIKHFLRNKTLHRSNHQCMLQPKVLHCSHSLLQTTSTSFIPPSTGHKIFSAPPVFSPSVSYSSICFQSSVACSSIHPSTPPSSILSLTIPARLFAVPSLITIHPDDWCLLISSPSFLFAFLFIPASSLFVPSLSSSKDSAG